MAEIWYGIADVLHRFTRPLPHNYKGSGRGKPKEQILRSRLRVYPDSPLPLLTYELALHITEFSLGTNLICRNPKNPVCPTPRWRLVPVQILAGHRGKPSPEDRHTSFHSAADA
jgi:hypothetical protein